MGRSKGPKPPKGEEKKNQLDLFRDWAVEAGKRAVAAAAAAKEAAEKKLEELDLRTLKICGWLLPGLTFCTPSSRMFPVYATVIVLVALLALVPWVVGDSSKSSSFILRAGKPIGTILFVMGIFFLVSEGLITWSHSRTETVAASPIPQQKPIIEGKTPTDQAEADRIERERERQAAKERDAVKEAARVADCLAKETAADKASEKHKRRERDFNTCATEYETALTWKSLDAYCTTERRRMDGASRTLRDTVANMCSTTGSTKKGR